MQYVVMYATGVYSGYLNEFQDINFKFWIYIIQTLYIDVTSDVRICGCFSKPEGVRKQNILGYVDIMKLVLRHSYEC
jgi:hypothetical protein